LVQDKIQGRDFVDTVMNFQIVYTLTSHLLFVSQLHFVTSGVNVQVNKCLEMDVKTEKRRAKICHLWLFMKLWRAWHISVQY